MADIGPEAAAVASGALVLRQLFGPSVREVGEAMRRWTELRLRNVGRVVENAAEKLGDPDEAGEVNTRVAMHILEEGSYSDDPIVVDYLGGVLAASKTSDGFDDRGTAWTAMIGRLPAIALRTHYVLYRTLRDALVGQDLNLGDGTVAGSRGRMFLPYRVWHVAMDLREESADVWAKYSETVWLLHREGLIGDTFRFGGSDHVKSEVPGVEESGLVWVPSAPGIWLFMWAHGYRTAQVNDVLSPELAMPFAAAVEIPAGAINVHEQRLRNAEEEHQRAEAATATEAAATDDDRHDGVPEN